MKPHRVAEPQLTATDTVESWVSTTNGAPTDVFDRVVDILTWKTTTELATAIASDKQLAMLIRQQELGGAA